MSTGSARGLWAGLALAVLACPAGAWARESGEFLKVDVPPALRLIEIGKLSAHFEDVNGNFINPGFTQFSFTPGSALVAVDPADPKLEPGAVEVHSDVMPKAFSGMTTIRAAALGFAPQTKTVRITWPVAPRAKHRPPGARRRRRAPTIADPAGPFAGV